MNDMRPDAYDEALPHNIEAEQQLLGCLLLWNENLMKCGDLEARHFFDPVHQAIFQAIIDRIGSGRLASPVTIKTDLEHHDGLNALGGPAYLARLAGAAVASFAADHYAREVRELAGRRALIRALSEGLAALRLSTEPTGKVAAQIEADVVKAQRVADAKPSTHTFLRATTDAAARIFGAYQGQTGLAGISTGLRDLDALIGGLERGKLYVLGARPSMGKTAIALNIAAKAAARDEPALVVSLEMPPADLVQRFYSQALAERGLTLPYSDMGRGRMDEHEARALVEAMKAHEALPLDLGGNACKDPLVLRQAVRRVAADRADMGGLKLVVVDYLQLIRPANARNKFDAVSEASQCLKEIALEFDVPVLALSQLSRSVETRENKRPVLSDLRESGQIEQDADTVMFAYREAYYLAQDVRAAPSAEERLDAAGRLERVRQQVEIIVAKQRSGRLDFITAHLDLPTNTMRDKEDER